MDSYNHELEVVTFGETMTLFTPESGAGLEYASKLNCSFAGTESTVAIGVARLGHRVGWFGRLGEDPHGRMILKRMRGEGVDVSKAVLAADAPTGLMMREYLLGKTSVYYYRKNSAASFMEPGHLDESYIAGARILHFTGVTPALSASCADTVREAAAMAQRHGVKICFDPNLRLKLWGIEKAREVILELAEKADYFLPGLDELRHIYGTQDFDEIIRRLSGLQAVSIVKGDGKVYIVDNGTVDEVPFVPVKEVVDPIGAGDGFCAGFLAGILKGYSPVKAAGIGNLVGSIVVQTQGDWEGIPTWKQVENVMNHERHIER